MADDPHDLVVRTIREHAGALLRTARKHSLCADDAHDAYQRGLEIFLRRAATIEAATAANWLHVVIKHEAIAIRQARGRYVAAEEADLDARAAAGAGDTDERVLRFDRLARSAEALARLKPQEVRALWLKAQGHSYAEIAASEGWTYTKVNRCLTEGRRSFLDRYASIERGEECERWAPVVSAMVDGEATAEQLAAARPHLRRCAGCRATVRELRTAGPRMAGVLPVGAVVGVGVGEERLAAAGGGLLDALGRAVESVAVAVHERASAWALKLQLAAETASAGKVAAVAASAVAVAGGGAVTVAEVRGDRDARAEARATAVRHASAGASGRAALARVAWAPAAVASPAAAPRHGDAAAHRLAARDGSDDDRASGRGAGASEFSPEARSGSPRREFAAALTTATTSATTSFERPAPAATAAPTATGPAAAPAAPAARPAPSSIVERAPRPPSSGEFEVEG